MFNFRFCPFCVVTVLCIFLCIGSSHTKKCAERDKQALLNLKDGFADERNLLSSWKGEDCCKWKGISCNNLAGHVTRLDLRFSNLTPVIGAEDLKDLGLVADTMPMTFDEYPLALGGPLPNCWQKFPNLTVLNLANNGLSGRIPKSFGTLGQIESMHLNNNNFSGEIPSLTHCRSLRFIDFGDNILQGALPSWVGDNLLQLIVLRLRANKIQGNIPANLCYILSLQVLDLSTNNITGEIPQCLSNITALSNMEFPKQTTFYYTSAAVSSHDSSSTSFVDETILTWKGENREYGKILGLMTIIDLSNNHLAGEIPQSITKLVALAGLNLSGNNLTGFIPNNIGHMQMLESLDLSRNRLYGRMPTSFSNLSFLSYMNLSLNNLSGEIPVSTQLQSFDASTYAGNIGLCGPPLTNQCPGDVVPDDKNGTNEEDDELINFGFYISLGLGFCVGFWGVCGTLIIKSSWRHAYFQFFNTINDWICETHVIFIARVKNRFQIQD